LSDEPEITPLRGAEEHEADSELSEDDYDAAYRVIKKLQRARARREEDKNKQHEKALHAMAGDDPEPRLSDAELLARLLDFGRKHIDLYKKRSEDADQAAKRIAAVVARQVHESVQRAADEASNWIEERRRYATWKMNEISAAVIAIEKAATFRDVATGERCPAEVIVNTLHHLDIERPNKSLNDMFADVETVEFAATNADDRQLRKIVDAMGRILGGVTTLKAMGFQTAEIQTAIEDLVGLQKEHGKFTLLSPVVDASGKAKGTNRNNRWKAPKREQWLAKDENKWVLRYLNTFWFRYWRNAFESSLPEEHEKNIMCVANVLPRILDAAERPQGKWDLLGRFPHDIDKHRESGEPGLSRVRLQDDHILKARDRLVGSATGNPMDVVEIEGAEPEYWTRRRADAAGLKIAPPLLRVVADEDDHAPKE
jgi:hypothetical protein